MDRLTAEKYFNLVKTQPFFEHYDHRNRCTVQAIAKITAKFKETESMCPQFIPQIRNLLTYLLNWP